MTETPIKNQKEMLEIKKYCNRNEKCSWWIYQFTGHGQGKNQDLENVISRNFQTGNIKKKKNEKDRIEYPKTVTAVPKEENK